MNMIELIKQGELIGEQNEDAALYASEMEQLYKYARNETTDGKTSFSFYLACAAYCAGLAKGAALNK